MSTATARRPQNVVVSSGQMDIEDEQFLGHFTMFTSPDDPVSAARFLRAWKDAGLNPDDLPAARQPVHVFQSACASVRSRSRDKNGTRYEVAADEIQDNGTRCSYQVTSKRWDRDADEVTFERALRASFDKKSSDLTFDAFDPELILLEQEIRKHFEKHGTKIPGPKIRNAVRSQLLDIGAQNLRRRAGGVYFVPKRDRQGNDTVPVLEGLANVLDDTYGDRADFYYLPMLNSEGEREMVRKHFTINAVERAEDLTVKVTSRLRQGKGRGVYASLLTNTANEIRLLKADVQRYQDLVDLEADTLESNLSALDNAFDKLQALADS